MTLKFILTKWGWQVGETCTCMWFGVGMWNYSLTLEFRCQKVNSLVFVRSVLFTSSLVCFRKMFCIREVQQVFNKTPFQYQKPVGNFWKTETRPWSSNDSER